MNLLIVIIAVITVFIQQTNAQGHLGIHRHRCSNRNAVQKFQDAKADNPIRERLAALRKEMLKPTYIQGFLLDAYIISHYDEHQHHKIEERDQRIKFMSGFTGHTADVVITLKSAALWTDAQFIEKADRELDCDWKIFKVGEHPSIASFLANEIRKSSNTYVGADPKLIPHFLWHEWKREMRKDYIKLVTISKNLVDIVWGDQRPAPNHNEIKVHPLKYAGEKWVNKVKALRESLPAASCDAMVVTSLTEIAYLLNLRGSDIPYIPVFKAYLLVTQKEIILYTDLQKVTNGVRLHLKSSPCLNEKCVQIKPYDKVWDDLFTLQQQWTRVLLPSYSIFDMGVSEEIYSSISGHKIVEQVSPIIYMRAQKNPIEREGMRRAHIRDAVAMCDALAYFEDSYLRGDSWNEYILGREVDRSRREQDLNKGLSFQTISAFGENAARPYYYATNESKAEITDENVILIDSGGQYLDGTTDVARTIHLGQPSPEQMKAYTNILIGIIRLSMLVFPENVKPSEVDAVIRMAIWKQLKDYPHLTGQGIGSYLSVDESPIKIAYTTKYKYTFKEGYFFSVAPGYYKPNEFGIRLKNVYEVVDTGEKNEYGVKFLKLQAVTLLPFDAKFIDRRLLSIEEVKWLNEYNAQVRIIVGEEMKKQVLRMHAFYWMMNKTKHIPEFLDEAEYRRGNSNSLSCNVLIISLFTVFTSVLIAL